MNRNALKEVNAFFVNKTHSQQSFTTLTLSSFSASPDLLELFNTKQTSQLQNCESRASQGNSMNLLGKFIFMKTDY